MGGAHPPSGSYDRPRSGLQLPQANRFIPEDDWWEGGVDAYGVSIPKIGGKTGKPPNFMEHQKKNMGWFGGFYPPYFWKHPYISIYIGQISSRVPRTTDGTPKWWWIVREMEPRLFQGNLGWWNIIPFGQRERYIYIYTFYIPGNSDDLFEMVSEWVKFTWPTQGLGIKGSYLSHEKKRKNPPLVV